VNDPEEGPEFGPRGYVPPQAAKRARKIVLREPMGLGWPIAAVTAGVLLGLLGLVYLLTQTGPPGPPFATAGPLSGVDPRGAAVLHADTTPVLVVRAGGGVRAFLAPEQTVAYCAASKRLEGDDGSVWTVDGRLTGGPGASLTPIPVQVHDGVVYADPRHPVAPPPPAPAGAEPAC
jgi:nitrite reductase/ring-hydroxylating ferredoxin subunit